MSNLEARKFFLKPESYFNGELPAYFNFEEYLQSSFQFIEESTSEGNIKGNFDLKMARESEKINCKIYANKDGKYDWRPLELVNPYLYGQLILLITSEKNWELIINRFKENSVEKIFVASIPVESNNRDKDKKEQILNWWSSVEQKSIEYALEFKNVIHLDISNCYGSIYTHTIAWALHNKDVAKKSKTKKQKLLGDEIDQIIMNMQHGQTNGIPQGSVLMDFIAEIVLSYCDKLLEQRLINEDFKLENYKIIRYRDDYRIFSNSKNTIEIITKELNDILMSMNFKLNSKKTKYIEETVLSSIKEDKIEYQKFISSIYYKENNKHIFHMNCQKHLLQILAFSKRFPNSGSVVRLVDEFNNNRGNEILNINQNGKIQCVSIVTEIMLNNFRTVPLCTAILSKILNSIEDERTEEILNLIIAKFKDTPNVDLLNIWLQRLTLPYDKTRMYVTDLCRLVSGDKNNIFDSKWVKTNNYKINDKTIIDEEKIQRLTKVISNNEVSIFSEYLL